MLYVLEFQMFDPYFNDFPNPITDFSFKKKMLISYTLRLD